MSSRIFHTYIIFFFFFQITFGKHITYDTVGKLTVDMASTAHMTLLPDWEPKLRETTLYVFTKNGNHIEDVLYIKLHFVKIVNIPYVWRILVHPVCVYSSLTLIKRESDRQRGK